MLSAEGAASSTTRATTATATTTTTVGSRIPLASGSTTTTTTVASSASGVAGSSSSSSRKPPLSSLPTHMQRIPSDRDHGDGRGGGAVDSVVAHSLSIIHLDDSATTHRSPPSSKTSSSLLLSSPRHSLGSRPSKASSSTSSSSGGGVLHFVQHTLTPQEEKVLANHALFARSLAKHTAAASAVLQAANGSSTTAEDVEDKDILVCVRSRPILDHEAQRGVYSGVTVNPAGNTVHLHSLEPNIQGNLTMKTKDFTVDYAFGEDVTNEEVYQKTAKGLIPIALGGGVGALFAYGQTGSGKTYTMTALEQRVARDIFQIANEYSGGGNGDGADKGSAEPGSEENDFDIRVTFFELCGNVARDLISPSGLPGDVTILEDVFGRIQVKGALEVKVNNPTELLDIIERGAAQRRTEGTAKNATSSRSHAVCRIRIRNLRIPSAEEGIMYLLDLAGSESAADTRWHDKDRVQESVDINKSLATLKDCIRNRALAASSGKHVHIPYRNSKLTVLLKEAFELESARLCKTVVIAALNPGILDTTQSHSTLRYTAPLKVAVPLVVGPVDPDDPSNWSNQTLRDWVGANSRRVDPEILCPSESGKQILRLPETEFLRRCLQCGLEEKAAKAFYLKLWKMLIDARTKVKRGKMNALKQRMTATQRARQEEEDKLWGINPGDVLKAPPPAGGGGGFKRPSSFAARRGKPFTGAASKR